MSLRILVVATLDTKEEEAAFLCERIAKRGYQPYLVDCGVLGEPEHTKPAVTSAEVATASGTTLEAVRTLGARGPAVEQMMRGLETLVPRLEEEEPFAGGVGIGGAEGALLASAALRPLPLGRPKLIVSPILSGTRACGPFVGETDMGLLHSVADLQGLNSYTEAVLDLAASMVTGGGSRLEPQTAPAGRVGMSLNGNTTWVGTQIRRSLEAEGYEVVAFHSNGVGGITMEDRAVAGDFAAVIDLTTNELVEELLEGLFVVEGRIRRAGAAGIPRVLVPGCLDFVCQGRLDELPKRFQGRPADAHNPEITLVQVTPEEARQIATEFVRRASESDGKVEIVLPTGGLSLPGSPGGSFPDERLNRLFADTIAEEANGRVPVRAVETPINHLEVAQAVVETFLRLMRAAAQTMEVQAHG